MNDAELLDYLRSIDPDTDVAAPPVLAAAREARIRRREARNATGGATGALENPC